MVFLLAVILMVLGIAWGIFAYVHFYEFESFFGWFIGLGSGIIAIIMLIAIICAHLGTDAKVELWREQYKALTYKLESGKCRDEFGLLSKEIIDEIQNWNQDVVYNKSIQKDFWIGVFYPDIFDEFETIDYERYENKAQDSSSN